MAGWGVCGVAGLTTHGAITQSSERIHTESGGDGGSAGKTVLEETTVRHGGEREETFGACACCAACMLMFEMQRAVDSAFRGAQSAKVFSQWTGSQCQYRLHLQL